MWLCAVEGSPLVVASGTADAPHDGALAAPLLLPLELLLDHILEVLLDLVLREEVVLLARQVPVPQRVLVVLVVLALVGHGGRRLDLQIPLPELLVVQLLEWDGTGRGVRLIALEGHVGDERADIFLELGQVRHDVVLSEHDTVLIVHLSGDREEKLAVNEGSDHVLDRLLHLPKHSLRLGHLIIPTSIKQVKLSQMQIAFVYLRFFDFSLVKFELVLHLPPQILFLLLRVVLQFDHFVDLFSNFAI